MTPVAYAETPVTFRVAGDVMLGIAALPVFPESTADCGVLIVVGGPQYRVGSHRQFLLLSRRLAAAGYPVFRFDYRGMGDSEGAMRGFDAVSDDVGAAIEAFMCACPTIRRVVLWGLCDAASAALLYLHEVRDRRVTGAVLLNPWVRSDASLAQTHIKHYYGQRLLQPAFWRKLLCGQLPIRQTLRGFIDSVRLARGRAERQTRDRACFQERMADGWRDFPGKLLLILSGDDYTAKEFIEYAVGNADWSGLLARKNAVRVDLPDADHTFSCAASRAAVENATLEWLAAINSTPSTDFHSDPGCK